MTPADTITKAQIEIALINIFGESSGNSTPPLFAGSACSETRSVRQRTLAALPQLQYFATICSMKSKRGHMSNLPYKDQNQKGFLAPLSNDGSGARSDLTTGQDRCIRFRAGRCQRGE
jgi:hypothetical protein